MTIFEITKENVKELPLIDWLDNHDELFDSIVIVPTGEIHESGYQCMEFVFCNGDEAVKRVDRGSDVLHIDGIGGYGGRITWNKPLPTTLPLRSWSIDCTPNGFLRLFSSRCRIKGSDGLSSYEIFGVGKEELK